MDCSHVAKLRSIRKKPAESEMRREERDKKAQNCRREGGELVTSIFQVLMHSGKEGRQWKGELSASW